MYVVCGEHIANKNLPLWCILYIYVTVTLLDKIVSMKSQTFFLIPIFCKIQTCLQARGHQSWKVFIMIIFICSLDSLTPLANNLCNKDPVCNSLTNRAGEILARFTNIKCKIHNLLCLTSSFWPNKLLDTAMNHSFLLHI